MTKIKRFCYLLLVRAKLSCPSDVKKVMLDNFKQQFDEYIEQNPQATFEDIISTFGNPETVAEKYLATVDRELMRKYRRKIFIIKLIVIIALAVAALLVYNELIHEEPGYIIIGLAEPVSEETDLTDIAETTQLYKVPETVTQIIYPKER